ncbi:MAG: J domain-containing protein [Bacteroidota bacterium]
MQTLFGEFEDEKAKSLKIVLQGKKSLSKNQQLFNRLTKRIENLEKENVKLSDKLARLLSFHGREIKPLETEVANARIQLAIALGKATGNIQFSKKQVENIAFVIVEQCDEAFCNIEPTPEQEAFYDKWADVSYQQGLEQQMEEEKVKYAEYMSQAFGMDIDMNDFDASEEGQARFYSKVKDQFDKSGQNEARPTGKKSKKQLIYEEALKVEEALKAKSIRNIFIALAKVLHPDTETNVILKAEKEEIMKKVTSAYDQKDLTTLLKLEMEWVHKTTENLEKLTDDKLGIYISALKQQVKELEAEKYRIYNHPRFNSITSYSFLTESHALKEILGDKSELTDIFSDLKHYIATFEWTSSKKQILDFVKEYSKEDTNSDLEKYLADMLSNKRHF